MVLLQLQPTPPDGTLVLLHNVNNENGRDNRQETILSYSIVRIFFIFKLIKWMKGFVLNKSCRDQNTHM